MCSHTVTRLTPSLRASVAPETQLDSRAVSSRRMTCSGEGMDGARARAAGMSRSRIEIGSPLGTFAQMSFAEFQQSVTRDAAPPTDLSLAMQALWHDARGDWDRAH